MPKKFPSIPVGTIVQFFDGGDVSQLPRPGIVVMDCNGGILQLEVCSGSGGTMSMKRNVRHSSDAGLRVNAVTAQRFGCWDHVPAYDKGGFYDEPALIPVVVPSSDLEIEARIKKLHEEGQNSADITRNLHTKGWNKARVDDYIEAFETIPV